jgi:Ca2+-transporting ATPase
MMVQKTRDSSTLPEVVAAPHTLAVEEVAAHLGVQPDFGVTGQQARERREQYGPNRLPEAPPRSAWLVFFGQFKSILILILIGAALLSALVGSVKDAPSGVWLP